jgi:hypothetical protein
MAKSPDLSLSSSPTPGAPGQREQELARATDIALYERQIARGSVTMGNRRKRASLPHWKCLHFDELVVTDKRVVFATGGQRQRQLSVDPALAKRFHDAITGDSSKGFSIERDNAASVPFVTEAQEARYIFKPFPFPRALKVPVSTLSFFFFLAVFIHTLPLGVLLWVLSLVVLTKGLPIPWDAIQLTVSRGSGGAYMTMAQHHASAPERAMLSVFRPLRLRLVIPDETQRHQVLSALQRGADRVRGQFAQLPQNQSSQWGSWER